MKPLSSFSRRNFLRTLAVTGLASGSAFAAPASNLQPFNEIHDLVIVGSGFAGLSAALPDFPPLTPPSKPASKTFCSSTRWKPSAATPASAEALCPYP